MSMFRPALAEAAVAWVAPQSLVTKPVKPNCWRSTVLSRYGFWQAKVPLTVLYEHITEDAAPCWVASWNAGR